MSVDNATATMDPQQGAQAYNDAASVLGGSTAGQFQQSADDVQQQQNPVPDAPLNGRSGPAPQLQAPPPKKSVLADIAHAIGDVLGGPRTVQRVNPATGAIEEVPLSREGRIANTAGIYLRGAAAGAAQHGPGAVGKAALAGVQEQQATQQQQTENTLAASRNTSAVNVANQEALLRQASLQKMSHDQARAALDMKAFGMQLDAAQVTLANSLQSVLDEPGVKVIQHFDSNSDINAHLEMVGPELSKKYAIDLTRNNIRLFQNPKGGFDAVEVPKKIGETGIGPGRWHTPPSTIPQQTA